jgi:hypothetical protein
LHKILKLGEVVNLYMPENKEFKPDIKTSPLIPSKNSLTTVKTVQYYSRVERQVRLGAAGGGWTVVRRQPRKIFSSRDDISENIFCCQSLLQQIQEGGVFWNKSL